MSAREFRCRIPLFSRARRWATRYNEKSYGSSSANRSCPPAKVSQRFLPGLSADSPFFYVSRPRVLWPILSFVNRAGRSQTPATGRNPARSRMLGVDSGDLRLLLVLSLFESSQAGYSPCFDSERAARPSTNHHASVAHLLWAVCRGPPPRPANKIQHNQSHFVV